MLSLAPPNHVNEESILRLILISNNEESIFLNALQVVQTAIHLEKFILVLCTTRNVKNAKKIIAGCTIRNDNIF